MFDWIPLIGVWSGLHQTLTLVVAPILFLISAYAFHYRANYVWEPKNKRYTGQYHWLALPSDVVVWTSWTFATVAGLLLGLSLMLQAVSVMSFGEAAIFIFLALIIGFLVSVGALGISTHRLHEIEFNSDEESAPLAAALVLLAFFGIVATGVTLTALVLIPVGGLAVLGAASFPAEGGGEFSFGMMSLIVTSTLFIWAIAATVWD